MTPLQLASKLIALDQRATPGPWMPCNGYTSAPGVFIHSGIKQDRSWGKSVTGGGIIGGDAQFIAAARQSPDVARALIKANEMVGRIDQLAVSGSEGGEGSDCFIFREISKISRAFLAEIGEGKS